MKTPPPGKAPDFSVPGLSDFLNKLRTSLYTIWADVRPIQSYEVAIGDDSIQTFQPPQYGGFMFITTDLDDPKEAHSGQIYYDVGSSLAITEITSSANLDVSTSDVDGTTGADGNVTVAVQSGNVKVENRTGAECKFRVTFL